MNPNKSHLAGWIQRPLFWFVVALILRLLYLLEQGGSSPLFYQPMLDEREAYDLAMAILHGTTAAEPYFKAPGYSWILAAVIGIFGNAWPWTMRAIQHFAGAWLVFMVARLSATLTPRSSRRAWAVGIAGFLAATYAPMIRLEDNLSLDFWSVFFQSAMLCVLVPAVVSSGNRSRRILWAGCLAAAAWITRPTITVALPFIAAWLILAIHKRASARKAILASILFLLPVIATVGMVALRNEVVSGEPMAMPWQGGYSLYHANRPGATGRYYLQQHIVESDNANPTKALAINGYVENLSPDKLAAFSQNPNYTAVNQFWFGKTLDSIKQNPAAWIKLTGKKFVYLFSDKEIFNYEDFDLQRSRSVILRWLPGRFGVIFPLALASLAGLSLLSPVRRNIHLLLWITIIALGGGIALYYVSGRMRMPLAFPMTALAGFGAASFLRLSTRCKTAAIVLIVAAAAISWGDWWGVRSESMAHVDLVRMSNAAWQRGHYQQALDLAQEAERLSPDYPALPRLEAQALYGLGKLRESRQMFEKSVKMLGDDTSRRNIKVIDQDLKEAPEPTSP